MKKIAVWVLLITSAAALLVSGVGSRTTTPDLEWHSVGSGPLTVWSVYEGQIASRTVHTILSRLNGSAHITTLAREGSHVKAGDPLVQFDDAGLTREVVRLERDVTLAETELQSLRDARHPLKERSLQLTLDEARTLHEAERAFRDDSEALQEEGLLSDYDLQQQEAAVEQSRIALENAREQLHLTRTVLHPAEIRHAEAKLEAAGLELEVAREQLEQCTVKAPRAGVVVYLPLHVGGEFRAARIGDEVFKNQPFMAIHDMSDLVVTLDIPEADLSRLNVEDQAEVIPLAFQDLHMAGRVEQIGSVARTRSGRPRWQRYFGVEVGLEQSDPRLRTGMSVQVNVLSYHADQALRVPRTAVWWESGSPYCRVRVDRHAKVRELSLGRSDDQFYEVHGGLSAGDEVALD